MKYEIIELKSFGDERGSLISFEKENNCPFAVKRCFYIYDTKDSDIVRGSHANKKSEFLLVVISGSCRIKVDTGLEVKDFLLNNPKQALYLDKMVWKEMYEFSHNSVLLVLSNEMYDENEYIRSYEDFIKAIKG